MAHSQPHPKAGKFFRVNLDNGDIQAIEDVAIHGSLIQLLDWADRLPDDTLFSEREKQVALMCYAHRYQPNLRLADPVDVSSLKLDGVVYGISTIIRDEVSRKQLVLVRQIELDSE